MNYGLWQLAMYLFYIVLLIAAVSVIMGTLISFLLALLAEKSECTGDCDQGRCCTCRKGESNG